MRRSSTTSTVDLSIFAPRWYNDDGGRDALGDQRSGDCHARGLCSGPLGWVADERLNPDELAAGREWTQAAGVDGV